MIGNKNGYIVFFYSNFYFHLPVVNRKMKKVFSNGTAALIIVLSMFSCKKETDTQTSIPKNTLPPVSIPDDAQIFFRSSLFFVSSAGTYGQTAEYKVGDAFAFFKDFAFAKVSAGEVTVNGFPLSKDANGNYTYTKPGNVPEGISFIGNLAAWRTTGDTASGIPAIAVDDNSPFPAKPIIQDRKINTQETFLLAARDSVIADSTVFIIAGPKGSVRKVKGPNARSCVFSKEELKTLGTGRSLGLIQISPFNTVLDTNTISGYRVYFQKQTIASRYIDLE
jgi:hypothetical protein